MRYLYRYPEVVEKAGREYAPSLVCTYLYELAQRFNTFYNSESILGKAGQKLEEKGRTAFRLALTAAAAQVLKNGLWLLGIKAPERM